MTRIEAGQQKTGVPIGQVQGALLRGSHADVRLENNSPIPTPWVGKDQHQDPFSVNVVCLYKRLTWFSVLQHLHTGERDVRGR